VTDVAFIVMGVAAVTIGAVLLWRTFRARKLTLGSVITARDHAPVFYFCLLVWLTLLLLLGALIVMLAMHGNT
jgi:hypothetical protein